MKIRVERTCFLDGVLHAAGSVVTVDDSLPLANWMTPLKEGRGRATRPSGDAPKTHAPSREPPPAPDAPAA